MRKVIDLRQLGFIAWMLTGALLGCLLGMWLQALAVPLLHIRPQYAAYVGMAFVAVEALSMLVLSGAAYMALFDPYHPVVVE